MSFQLDSLLLVKLVNAIVLGSTLKLNHCLAFALIFIIRMNPEEKQELLRIIQVHLASFRQTTLLRPSAKSQLLKSLHDGGIWFGI